MSIGKRIRQLRRSLDLTQKEFAERMGVKQNTIATYETERSVPIDAVISLICREFNVSETWLRTGEGEMFAARSHEEEVVAAVENLLSDENPEWRRRLAVALSRFSPSDWDRLERELRFILDGEASERPAAETVKAAPSENETQEEYERRVFQGMTRAEYHEELDRQLDEQEKEMASAFSPSSYGTASSGGKSA